MARARVQLLAELSIGSALRAQDRIEDERYTRLKDTTSGNR